MAGEELFSKLARLRREDRGRGDRAAPLAPQPERARGDSLVRARLARMRQRAGRAAPAVPDPQGPLAERTAGPPRELVLEDGPAGPLVARTTRVPASRRHGAWRLDAAARADPGEFALFTGDGDLADLDPRRAIYLDTETSGLDGGAGTYVYMVGLGWFEGDEFVVWQGFLRGPEEERAMLAAAAARIAAAPAVVSFFGKVFDRHRMEDKLRLHGLELPFEGRPHLDLCFPFRRLTKGALPDARLQTMERHLAGLARVDDLPGALAPAAWFDFLADRTHRLEGVFRHNLDDVRSLATLTAYLGHVGRELDADDAPLPGPAGRRALARGRALAASKDPVRASEAFSLALSRGIEEATPDEIARAELEFAQALRKSQRAQEAREALERARALAEDAALARRAGDLLAKICEHDLGDFEAALECAVQLGDGARRDRLRRRLGLRLDH